MIEERQDRKKVEIDCLVLPVANTVKKDKSVQTRTRLPKLNDSCPKRRLRLLEIVYDEDICTI